VKATAETVPPTFLVHRLLGRQSTEWTRCPTPDPGPGELLLRIEAALTCGTDLKVWRAGGHARMLRPPCPFGHEMAGRVAAVGEEVSAWAPGDSVVVANSSSCGFCRACARGAENLCPDLAYLNGAFGEYLLVPARFVLRSTYRRPPHLRPEVAACAEPLACVVHGVDALGLASASDVLVAGAGPIGLFFVALLAAAGHRVTVVDPHARRLEIAQALGAERGVPARLGEEHGALEGSTFDATVDAAGLAYAGAALLPALRPGGTGLAFAGLPAATVAVVDLHQLHYRELSLRGVYHFRRRDFAAALDLLARGAVDPRPLLTSERPLAELPQALAAMDAREDLKIILRP
jgi:L-iditol 2-dehydrogenase